MARTIKRVSAREGYDRWADIYDATPNPVVAMDARHTIRLLSPKRSERILDAGCGTGRHLEAMIQAGSAPVGIDSSFGMLEVACRRFSGVPLVQADLGGPLPLKSGCFDAVLCALVGEHLRDLTSIFQEMHRVLKPRGRLVFSVYHPAMAAAGIEAHFERDGVDFRLGAIEHSSMHYLEAMRRAGFIDLRPNEHLGDEALVEKIPSAAKYLGFPILLVVTARREN